MKWFILIKIREKKRGKVCVEVWGVLRGLKWEKGTNLKKGQTEPSERLDTLSLPLQRKWGEAVLSLSLSLCRSPWQRKWGAWSDHIFPLHSVLSFLFLFDSCIEGWREAHGNNNWWGWDRSYSSNPVVIWNSETCIHKSCLSSEPTHPHNGSLLARLRPHQILLLF